MKRLPFPRPDGMLLHVPVIVFFILILAGCSKGSVDSKPAASAPPPPTTGQQTTALSAQQVLDVQTNWLYYGLINDENLYYFLYMGVQLLEADSILSTGITPNIPGALICGAHIRVDSNATTRMLIITYNGNSCPLNNHDTSEFMSMHLTATGTVVVSSPRTQEWGDTSQVKIDIQHLVMDVPGNRLIINGIMNVKNVTGGNPVLLHAGAAPIVQTVKSDGMTATFRDGSIDQWQLDMKRVYSYSDGIVITTTGVHANDTASNICQWGTDRGGHPFVTRITIPIVNEQSCGMHVTAGETNESTFIDQPGFPYFITYIFTLGTDPYTGHTGCPLPGEKSYIDLRILEPNFNARNIFTY